MVSLWWCVVKAETPVLVFDQHALWLIVCCPIQSGDISLHLDSCQADRHQAKSKQHTYIWQPPLPHTAFFGVSRTRPRWFNNVAGVGSETSSQQLSALAEEFFSWRIETWPNYGTRFGINDYNNLTVEYTEGEFVRQRVSKARGGRVCAAEGR